MNDVKLIDFHAEWCGPCKQLEPAIEDLDEEFETVDFEFVDIDEDFETANEYMVRSVPTVVITANGDIQDRFEGMVGKNVLKESLQTLVSGT